MDLGTIHQTTDRVGVIFRAFVPDDRTAVDNMLRACGVFTDEEIGAALEIVDAWTPVRNDEDYAIFVLEIDYRVQGYVCIGKTPLTMSTWHLYWICVHPDHQRIGAGRALLSHIENVIRSHGGKRLALETSGQPRYERTRRFYKNAGFLEVGRIRDFYKTGDDCVTFCKELNE